uniref:Uncharacterized protein n=1 Tax=Rhizophora mucronata TaxID=61149 RepID=A0A2P2QAM0_RHIMU
MGKMKISLSGPVPVLLMAQCPVFS